MNKPEFIKDVHIQFLEELREGGSTNMLKAVPHIQQEFYMEESDAKTLLRYWMSYKMGW
tara:strand:+ start:8043 stop:8219 length:177 start_codon:yes stop_codon:yes gene_type:complete